MVVSSVIAVFVALVAVVADVALVAVAALPPIDRLDAVPVKPVPAPVKDVALRTPVEGTNDSLVDAVLAGRLPVVVVTHVG